MYKIYFSLFFLFATVSHSNSQCPLNSACTPGAAPATNTILGRGIYRIQLANLDTLTNGAIDGYQDYSCRRGAALVQNATYTLRVQTGTQAAENVVAWLDYNNDGSFAASERVLYSLNARTHSATFTVPVTATLNQSLRLRIAADDANFIPTACATPQYSQTEDYQVHIAAGNPAPVADFATPDSVTCTGVAAFQDNSRNAPTNWHWSFGDGSNSTLQHPVHTYAAAGTYTVKLRVCNAGGCDSLSRTSYVLVRADGPRPTSCVAPTVAYCCQYGITRVRIASLDHSSTDGQASYEDFSCAYRTALTTDQPYTLQLTTGGVGFHDVRLYLDLNDDGNFSGPNELLYQSLAVKNPVIPFTIASALSPVFNKALRLRIVADYAGSPAPSPCGPVQWGQAEDYSVILAPTTTRPVAAATLTYVQSCGPTQIAFTNTSRGAVSYSWNFGDGSTSTVVSPTHSYGAAGAYQVRLVAQNAFGRDTVRLQVAVAATCPTYCITTPTGNTSYQPTYLTRLKFADIDNIAPRSWGTTYYDYTGQVATVVAGQSYSLQAEAPAWSFPNVGPWCAVDVYLDTNQDGQFGPSEHKELTSVSPYLLTIHIPAGAPVGATRMRVIIRPKTQFIYPNGCPPTYLFGSVEDYTVVVLPAALPPVPGFIADLSASCNSLVQFRDTSQYRPTSWQWSFGDGGTSTVQHPQHAYATTGTYSVSLQAHNAYGTQTVSRTGYITVSALAQGPRPAACLPIPIRGIPNGGHGIDSLKIGQVFTYHQAVHAPGFRDETCTLGAIQLLQGASYTFRFRDLNPTNTSCFVWLDINDNGLFDASSELLFNSLPYLVNTGYIAGTLSIPTSTLLNRPLRLRVATWGYDDYSQFTTVPNSCNRDESTGQVRDFTVIITANPLALTSSKIINTNWQIVPNPSLGIATIHGPFTTTTLIQVIDIMGRTVQRELIRPDSQGNLPLTLSQLPKGLYLVCLQQYGWTKRIIIE